MRNIATDDPGDYEALGCQGRGLYAACHMAGAAQTNCPASGYFAVTPPDDSSAVTAEDPTHICGGAITISPFTIAPFMGS